MESAEEKYIVKHLLKIGCCIRCALRMLNRYFNFAEAHKLIEPEALDDTGDGSEPKKLKPNPCIVCLDTLEESFITELIASVPLDKVKEYDNDSYVCCLSAPASVMIREASIKCYLKEAFPKFFTDLKTIRKLNKVWKECIAKHLNKAIGRGLDNNSSFSINFNLDYECEAEETEVMAKLAPIKFNNRQKSARKFNGEVFSRHAIEEALTASRSENLKRHLAIPPYVPAHRVTIKSIDLHSESIFIAGRYCKYSRTIGQTPWVHEDTNITDCVQDFIFRGIEKVLGYSKDSLTFSASGREDYDVRCLGKGRPFYIQIDNPKVTKIRFDTFRRLEREINVNREISIRDMQIVNKCDLKEIKNGEQFKSKHYTALCVTDCADIDKAVEVINKYGAFEIQQLTPLRVLHRRTLDTRKRSIYEMKAKAIPGKTNMFILDLLTQAGTYVKELVNGDFNRTNPSITNMIGATSDILALDVNSINLDWPPEIKYKGQYYDANTSAQANRRIMSSDKTSTVQPIGQADVMEAEVPVVKEPRDVDGSNTSVG